MVVFETRTTRSIDRHMTAVAQYADLDVRALSGALGAEVRGIDVTSLDENGFTTVHTLLLEYGVLALHGHAHLTVSQLREFGMRWGKLDVHGFAPFEGFDDALRVRADPDHPQVSEQWHTDASWKEIPPKFTMLLARQMPSAGGDTLFASQYKAYEDLSDAMKTFVDPLDVQHDGRIIDLKLAEQSVTHPLVITHPETGRKALYVNANYTQRVVQLAPRESTALLKFLFAHCTRERYQARVRYEPGTLAIWDQRCVQHAAAADFDGETRELHRIAVLGDAPPSR